MTVPLAEPRVCDRCRLVFIEVLPPVPGWSGVCPRCGLVSDSDAPGGPGAQEDRP